MNLDSPSIITISSIFLNPEKDPSLLKTDETSLDFLWNISFLRGLLGIIFNNFAGIQDHC